jgi:hypothetical protein
MRKYAGESKIPKIAIAIHIEVPSTAAAARITTRPGSAITKAVDQFDRLSNHPPKYPAIRPEVTPITSATKIPTAAVSSENWLP